MTNERDPQTAFERAVAEWDLRLAEAGAALDAEAPSLAVWDRISARLDRLDAERATVTVSADTGVWETSSLGVRRKRLYVDAATGWQVSLVKIDAGARLPPHDHTLVEECFVLEGAFEVDGATVRKGDLHLAFAGKGHGEIVSASGALLYLRTAIDS